jgi:hypothetical protein
MKFPSSMRNGGFHPSKFQKTREETLKGLLQNLLIPVAPFFGLT